MYPELLEIGPFPLRSYGLLLAIGFMVGAWVALREARRVGLDPDRMLNLIFVVLVAGVLGSRLFYVLGHLDYFGSHPLESLYLWRGGLTLFGGFVVAVPIGIYTTKRLGLDTWTAADALAGPCALGAAFGRVGCFLNGCCFGHPTDLPWGIHFPEGSEPHLHFGDAALHPAQLYNAAAGLFVFVVVMTVGRRLPAPGQRWWLFLGLYSVLRALIDPTRYYEESAILLHWSGGVLTESQAIGVGIGVVSAIAMWWLGRRHARLSAASA